MLEFEGEEETFSGINQCHCELREVQSHTQLDITKMAKETWEIFKAKYVGVTCLTKSRLQGLRREFEMLQIGDDETVTDFVGKLS
ncbi:unnamed protein product [Spirodela intermedia]|uniref:Uncharacterized protein n=1 Tax=Spirodela intermedia TaxID=51605 RepID=A0A7I8JP39_SPIIN|nr:unnamed protein product [Spirodela intermedia]CAA6671919.1 unnamed protein product [Spirodela intermedia]